MVGTDSVSTREVPSLDGAQAMGAMSKARPHPPSPALVRFSLVRSTVAPQCPGLGSPPCPGLSGWAHSKTPLGPHLWGHPSPVPYAPTQVLEALRPHSPPCGGETLHAWARGGADPQQHSQCQNWPHSPGRPVPLPHAGVPSSSHSMDTDPGPLGSAAVKWGGQTPPPWTPGKEGGSSHRCGGTHAHTHHGWGGAG